MSSLFRIAGLVVALVTGAINLAEIIANGPAGLARSLPDLPGDKAPAAFYALLFGLIAVLALFCVLFWWTTNPTRASGPRVRLRFSLVAQLLIGVLFPDLMILVASEAGYLLPARRSRWIYGQVAFFLVFVGIAGALGGLTPAPEVAGVARTPALALTILQVLAWQLFAFSAGHLAGRELEARRDLSLSNAELLATQQVLADSTRVSERLNIARELHDSIGHHLAALSLKLQLAGRLAEGAVLKPVQDAHLVAKLLMSDVRAAVSSMREEGSIDLAGALRTICAAIEHPRIDLQTGEAPALRDPARAHVLLRCAQEAITNAIRHSHATQLRIRLQYIHGATELEIQDDGAGAASWKMGNGLRGMRERINGIGGDLVIETAPGRGFSVLAKLPGMDVTS